MDVSPEQRRQQAMAGPPPEGNTVTDLARAHVLMPGHNFASVTDTISRVVLTQKTPMPWVVGLGACFMLVFMFSAAVYWLLLKGPGIWGVNIPVAWGFAIVNFVWWIGIGHAGTLISAILLLLRQEWRTSINRFAEAMTLFAVACAGMFPLLHLGRPWLFYWLLPYPNTMALWPQWRSPLVWDVFAVSTYGIVSLLFWYVGLIPDLATLRDRCRTRIGRIAYGIPALGWRGSAIHWQRYQATYILLGALATPLVVSVHTVVSFDFTIGIVPGWHSTIFPPYFVAGAIFSGFAMVLTLAIPLRKFYGLEDFITLRHLNACALLMIATGSVVGYGYFSETFFAWYGGDVFEKYLSANRAFGPYWWVWWSVIFCNVICSQLLWIKPLRRSVAGLWVMALLINTGMWLERYMIVVVSLHRDFLPSAWGMYAGTKFDWMTYIGTLGFFTMLFLLFVRLIPAISIAEMRELVVEKEGHEAAAEKEPLIIDLLDIPAGPEPALQPDGIGALAPNAFEPGGRS